MKPRVRTWSPARRKRVMDLLGQLSEAPGAPGFEGPVTSLLARTLKGTAAANYDNVGNAYFTLTGCAPHPRIILPAHLDEIAFMTTSVTDKGFVKFLQLGGWHSQALLGQRVRVITRKGAHAGVIGAAPPHLRGPGYEDKVVDHKDMFIDVGATSRKDAETRLGVRTGDPIVAEAPFRVLAGGTRCAGKAFDNRVGVAVMAETLKALKGTKHPNTVIGCGTVQEEVGTRGARTVPAVASPDVCLVVEASVLADIPGAKDEHVQGTLGNGPLICVLDQGLIPHAGLREFVEETARKAGIPVQLTSLYRGATDAREIQHYGRGIPSLYVGVPTRYVHTTSVILDMEDVERTVDLLVAVVRRLDAGQFERVRKRVTGQDA